MAAGNSPIITGFDPRNVPGMALWLDAADSSTISFSSGSNVSEWRDKSGNANNANVSSNAFATRSNTTSGLQFNNSFYTTPYTADPLSETAFLVFRYTGTNNLDMIMVGAYTRGRSIAVYNGDYVTVGLVNSGVAWLPRATFTPKDIQLITTQSSTSATSTSVNGGTATMGGGVTFTSGNVTTLGRENGTGGGYVGFLYELILFSNILTTSQRQQIEGYLAHKWGLNTALVGGVARPTQIPGCALWLDAADGSTITQSSGNVTQWKDKSGNASHMSLVVGSGPTVSSGYKNGNSALNFTGGSNRFNSPAGSARYPVDAYFVLKLNTITRQDILGMGGPTGTDNFNGLILGESVASRWQNGSTFATRTVVSPVDETSSDWILMSWSIANNNFYIYRNGVQLVQSASYTFSLNANSYFSIGCRYQGTATYLDAPFVGYMGEIIAFDSQLGSTQRQAVEGYLATKWGLRSSLPSTHPSYTGIAAQPFALTRPFTRAFQPFDIPGLALWLDAADTSTLTFSSGSNISAWRDKSSNAFSGTGIASPLYQTNSLNGLPGINFNGSSQYFNFGDVLNLGTNPIYIFAVCKFSSTADGGIVGKTSYRGYVSRWSLTRSAADGGMYMLVQNNTTATTYTAYANTSTSPQLLNGYWDRSAVYSFLNGVQQGTMASVSTANLIGTDRLLVGAYGDAAGTGTQTGFFFPGNMYEILVFSDSLTTSQRQAVEGYLAWKWGMNSQLPGVPLNPMWQSGLALWLDGADPLGTGLLPSAGTLATWVDKSGNGRNGTGVGTVPSFALSPSRVTFGGAGFYSTTLSAVPTAETVFFVSSTTSTAQITQIGCSISPTGGRGIFQLGGSMTLTSYAVNGRATQTGALTTGVPFITSSVFSGGNSQMFVNGVGGTVAGSTSFTGGGTTNIGAFTSRLDIAFPGAIYEVIIFNNALSTSQRQGVETYLARKWGLTVPTSTPHPFFRLPASSVLNEIPPPFTIGNAEFATDYSTAVSATGKTFYRFVTTGKTMTLTLASGTLSVDIYLIAGGGGGAAQAGGGGGAGGLVQSLAYTLSAGTYNIQIGVGGVGGVISPSVTYGRRGGNTTFASFTATGGGGSGGYQSGGAPENGGGCGAGAGYEAQPGSGSQGGSGGAYAFPNSTGGGGVASGAAGTGGANNGNIGGNGGQGIGINFAGTRLLLGGGGGGGGFTTTAGTGTFGGGNGSGTDRPVATSGSDGTGGGGGGGGWSGVGGGGRGGSGIFIIVA
jgi:hypothetical protein